MKIPNSIFWLLLGSIAIFYILKGNDMHDERIQTVMEKYEKNKQKED